MRRSLIIALALFTLYSFPYSHDSPANIVLASFLEGYARLIGFVIGWFDAGVSVRGSSISGQASVQMVRSCDAMEAKILFSSAVLAFPGSLARKLAALCAGLALLIFANVTRVTSLYLLLQHGQAGFDVCHLEVWPLLMMLTAAGGFFVATKYMSAPSRDLVPARPARGA